MPLWAQLLVDLRERLGRGEFTDRFPTDDELQHDYGVSRHTVREAVRRLQAEGTIVRERGRGSSIAPFPLEQPLLRLYSLADTAQEHGLSEHSDVITLRREPAAEAASPLELAPGDKVVFVERLRYIGEEPISLHRSWMPARLADPLLEADLRTGSLYDALTERCGIRVTGGSERIRPGIADSDVCRLLQLPAGQAVLFVERLALAGNEPVEWRCSVVRGDRYVFRTEWSAS